MILVVVKSVAIPPSIVANANGIKRRDLLIETLLAAPETAGSKTAAAAMLFIKSDRNEPAIITVTISRDSLCPPTLSKTLPTWSVTPVRCKPSGKHKYCDDRYDGRTLNPENASAGVSTPVTPRATTTSNATRSAGNTSVRKSISAGGQYDEGDS